LVAAFLFIDCCGDGNCSVLGGEVQLLQTEPEVKKNRPDLNLEEGEILILEGDRDKFTEPLRQATQLECLSGHLLEDGACLELFNVLLPLLRPAQVAQV
jgi:hypothetical protein